MDFDDYEEELRKRQAEATASAIDGLVGAKLDDSDFSSVGDGQTFPGDYSAEAQTRDLAMPEDAVGALVAKSQEPDPIKEQLASAASALAAENNPDPMPDPESPPVSASLTPAANRTVDLTAGGGDKPEDDVAGTSEDKAPLTATEQRDLESYQKEFGTNPDGSPIEGPASGNKPNPSDPSAAPAGTGPTADPDPGKGVDSNVERSPAAKEIPELQPGQPPAPAADDAAKQVAKVPSNSEPPKAGSAQTLTQTQPSPMSQKPDPWQALAAHGEAQKRQMMESLGERPGVNGWALLADVVFNRGRSIPQIISQADAAGRAYDHDKRAMMTRGSDPVQQQLALMRIQGTQQQQEIQRAAAAAKAEKDQRAMEAEESAKKAFLTANKKDMEKYFSPEEMKDFEAAPASTWRTLEARFRDRQKLDPEYQRQHALGREKDAFGAEQGQIQGRAANIGTAAANTAALSEADANARLPAQIAANAGKEANVSPIEAENQQLKKDAAEREKTRLAMEDARMKEAERARKVAEEKGAREENTRFKTHFSEKMKGAMDMMVAIDKIDAISEKYGNKGVPGKGAEGLQSLAGGDLSALYQRARAGDPEAVAKARDADIVANNLLGLSIDRLYEKSGKTFGNKEIAINAVRMAQNPLATPEQVDQALDTLRDIVKRGIVGEASPRPDLTREMFAEQGLNADKWLPAQWKAAEQPTAAPAPSPIDSAINGLTGQNPPQYNGLVPPTDPSGRPMGNLSSGSSEAPKGGLVSKPAAEAGKVEVIINYASGKPPKRAMLSEHEIEQMSARKRGDGSPAIIIERVQ